MRMSPTENRAGGRTGRESVWSVVRQENEREDQGKGVQDSGNTSTGDTLALKNAQEKK